MGEGKLATFAENLAVAVLIGSTALGPVLVVPTMAQLSVAFAASAVCHLAAFASLIVSVDMAVRSLRHKLVCRQ